MNLTRSKVALKQRSISAQSVRRISGSGARLRRSPGCAKLAWRSASVKNRAAQRQSVSVITRTGHSRNPILIAARCLRLRLEPPRFSVSTVLNLKNMSDRFRLGINGAVKASISRQRVNFSAVGSFVKTANQNITERYYFGRSTASLRNGTIISSPNKAAAAPCAGRTGHRRVGISWPSTTITRRAKSGAFFARRAMPPSASSKIRNFFSAPPAISPSTARFSVSRKRQYQRNSR